MKMMMNYPTSETLWDRCRTTIYGWGVSTSTILCKTRKEMNDYSEQYKN
jgi:hypothetical protein